MDDPQHAPLSKSILFACYYAVVVAETAVMLWVYAPRTFVAGPQGLQLSAAREAMLHHKGDILWAWLHHPGRGGDAPARVLLLLVFVPSLFLAAPVTEALLFVAVQHPVAFVGVIGALAWVGWELYGAPVWTGLRAAGVALKSASRWVAAFVIGLVLLPFAQKERRAWTLAPDVTAEDMMAKPDDEEDTEKRRRLPALVHKGAPVPAGYLGHPVGEFLLRVKLGARARTKEVALKLQRQDTTYFEEKARTRRARTDVKRAKGEAKLLPKEQRVEGLKLDAEAEELETKIAKARADREQLGKAAGRKGRQKPTRFQEMLAKVKRAADVEAARTKLKREHPDQAEFIEDLCDDRLDELKEGRQ